MIVYVCLLYKCIFKYLMLSFSESFSNYFSSYFVNLGYILLSKTAFYYYILIKNLIWDKVLYILFLLYIS